MMPPPSAATLAVVDHSAAQSHAVHERQQSANADKDERHNILVDADLSVRDEDHVDMRHHPHHQRHESTSSVLRDILAPSPSLQSVSHFLRNHSSTSPDSGEEGRSNQGNGSSGHMPPIAPLPASAVPLQLQEPPQQQQQLEAIRVGEQAGGDAVPPVDQQPQQKQATSAAEDQHEQQQIHELDLQQQLAQQHAALAPLFLASSLPLPFGLPLGLGLGHPLGMGGLGAMGMGMGMGMGMDLGLASLLSGHALPGAYSLAMAAAAAASLPPYGLGGLPPAAAMFGPQQSFPQQLLEALHSQASQSNAAAMVDGGGGGEDGANNLPMASDQQQQQLSQQPEQQKGLQQPAVHDHQHADTHMDEHPLPSVSGSHSPPLTGGAPLHAHNHSHAHEHDANESSSSVHGPWGPPHHPHDGHTPHDDQHAHGHEHHNEHDHTQRQQRRDEHHHAHGHSHSHHSHHAEHHAGHHDAHAHEHGHHDEHHDDGHMHATMEHDDDADDALSLLPPSHAHHLQQHMRADALQHPPHHLHEETHPHPHSAVHPHALRVHPHQSGPHDHA
jgi:hypothetical protein